MKSLPLITDVEPAEPQYWRSLDELGDTPEFRALLGREFPEQAEMLHDPVSRRQFLTLMGASLALAGVGGCSRGPTDKIVPYVKQPEAMTPGKPLYFATAMPMPGGATGLLVESHEGRPTKIEGNPDHPASLGATDAIAQASILGLYDPDRAQGLKHLGRIVAWDDALTTLQKSIKPYADDQGRGFAVLTPAINSPTLAAQLRELLERMPKAKWYVHEPALPDAARNAARMAFGEPVDLLYRVGAAEVVLALDSDFLTAGPNHLRHAREFMARRRLQGPGDVKKLNRLYAVEAMPTATGMTADHRLPLRAEQVEAFIRALGMKLGVFKEFTPQDERINKFLNVLTADLTAHAGASLVVVGPLQPPAVHILAHAINAKLGNFGKTVFAVPPVDARPESSAGLTELCQTIDSGEVELLLVLSCNPVYTSPADLDFAARLKKVKLAVRLGMYEDETAQLCHWHIPEAHYLEAWSDAVAPDGTATILQPLIAPLYEGKSAHDVVAAFAGLPNRPSREVVKEHWQKWHKDKNVTGMFEAFWRRSLHDGIVPGSTPTPKTPFLRGDWQQSLSTKSLYLLDGQPPLGYEIAFRPDPYFVDGRFSNNGWLMELPRPLTKLVWDNAAIVSPATARALGVTNKPGNVGGGHGELITEMVKLNYQGRSIEAPVFILPGHPDGSITLHLGFGRSKTGRIADKVGANAYALRTSAAPGFDRGLDVVALGKSFTLGCTQFHHYMEGRDIVRSVTAREFAKDPSCAPKTAHGGHLPHVGGFEKHAEELYTNPQVTGQQWGMAVDLSSCTGCGGCVAACQAENNIPVVGKDQVNRGREMHWLRIDRYFSGDEANPEGHFQPVMCMHCENAPCEVVCPVEATSHSPDGLNEMTYNRCVGTRYCANNCPYKVRRFNFLPYTDYAEKSLRLQRNPDVSVRVRGVMEKCTYCVQRIRTAEIEAKNQRRPIRDGEIVTACQAACPTEAIVFGNINDPASKVAKLKALQRNYGILTELNTKPRTTYLAAVRNPNEEMT